MEISHTSSVYRTLWNICDRNFWVKQLTAKGHYSNYFHQEMFHYKWDKVFKNGPSKTCGRQPLKNLIWFCPSRPYISKFLKDRFPQVLLGPFLNTLLQIFDRVLSTPFHKNIRNSTAYKSMENSSQTKYYYNDKEIAWPWFKL